MQIARPPNGFIIIESDGVAALIRAKAERYPRLPGFWSAVLQRLSMTGHREGVAIPRGKPGWRLFVDDGAPDAGLPRLKIIYRALGEGLTIYMVSVD